MLLQVKREKYYRQLANTWHVLTVLNVLKQPPYYTREIEDKLFHTVQKNNWAVWNKYDKQINYLWSMYSSEERKEIIQKEYKMITI
jgi:hypothetical protein